MTNEESNRKDYNSLLNYHVNILGMPMESAVKVVNKIVDDEGGFEKAFLTPVDQENTKPYTKKELKTYSFSLSIMTVFVEKEILDFLKLSGLTPQKAKMYLRDFETIGIRHLHDTNALLKLGLLKFPKETNFN